MTIRAPHADGQAARAKELRNIRAQEAKLRREKVRLLREELASLRKRVGAVERELRQLGEHEPVSSAGRIRWTDVFEQLDDTFTARQMAELTGAPPSHIGTVAHQGLDYRDGARRLSEDWPAARVGRGVVRPVPAQPR